MRHPLDIATALAPTRSVVVEACAGSGKTWLLVSRMIRLLLAGAAPSELLAITFTRKAAQEMTNRLHEWLGLLALGTDDAVRQFLREREIPEAEIDALMPRARGLLEAVLTAQPGPTVTTFHGWFLELLKRAPLEAGLPWGAPLLENESQLRREVLDAQLSRWAGQPQSLHGQALLALLDNVGEHGTRSILNAFLFRRAEWWAYTEGQAEPVAFALRELRGLLREDLEADPIAAFWANAANTSCAERIALALDTGTATELKQAAAIRLAISEQNLDALRKQLLDSKGNRPKKKVNDSTLKKLGDRADAYLRDYDALEAVLEAAAEHQTEQRIWQLNQHGLLLGHAYVEAYQQAKSQQGVMDFADAEWLACKLLQNGALAPALYLKLDARYRHLLLDEFQDTNPLQWQALSAWLGESKAADSAMTVFMVGDPKQAIYRFRRGEARIFTAAADFLQQHFNAEIFSNSMTRRLSPEVVRALNPVFANEGWFAAHNHAPANDALPGAVRYVAIRAGKTAAPDTPADILRNPLTTPLDEAEEKIVHLEAAEFARVLKEEVIGKWAIGKERDARTATPGDIMALVRKRTHLQIYERALEAVGIPYITSRRGGLLHALEAQDLIALLETLLMPHADLKLALTLKCPVFGCSDDDLLSVFAFASNAPSPPAVEGWGGGGDPETGQAFHPHPSPLPSREREQLGWDAHGWDRLLLLSTHADCPAALARAVRLLTRWQAQVGTLPVHDLLDRIYFEGDVLARYEAAVPIAMRPLVAANLHAFMQLALTQDGGRYPSLTRFIRDLKAMIDDADAAPDEGIAADGENAVRLLTIHGAKGLEAPIVWLLGGSDRNVNASYDVLSPWPPEAARPEHFSLYGKKEDRGICREKWFAEETAQEEREDANLLYVALTRAKQALIVSGNGECAQKTGKMKCAWLGRVSAAWDRLGLAQDLPAAQTAQTSVCKSTPAILAAPAVGTRTDATTRNGTAQSAAGEFFHACLERHAPPGNARNLAALATRLGLDANEAARIEQQAQLLPAQADLQRFFKPAHYLRAHNELAVLDSSGTSKRMDRVVEFETEIWLLDYKTGAADAALDAASLKARHAAQLGDYRQSLTALFAHKPIRVGVLLNDGRLVEIA